MRIIIAGGGTGGHLFPGIAIAQGFIEKDPRTEVLFVGTEKGIEKRVIPEKGFSLMTISSSGIRGVSAVRKSIALFNIPISFFQSVRIILSFKPDLVIGVGGYASGPVVLASSFMGVKCAIHEQNAEAGFTNRILSRFVDRIFTSHEVTLKQFSRKKSIYAGNPVRKELILRFRPEGSSFDKRNESEAIFNERRGCFCIFIFGGSQGARSLNRAFVDSLNYLDGIKGGLEFIVQTGTNDWDWVRKIAESSGFKVEVHPFIIDMADPYARADLVVCRAGAATISELTLCGKPAILVPYPYAIGDHQRKNARIMEKEGAAKVINDKDLSGETLAREIKNFYTNKDALLEMGRNAWRLGRPEATDLIVKECLKMVKGLN